MEARLTTYQFTYKVRIGGYAETLTVNRVDMFANLSTAVARWHMFADEVATEHRALFVNRTVEVEMWGITKIC